MSERLVLGRIQLATLYLFASVVLPSLSRAQAPVFEIEPAHSSIKFNVKASVKIAGKFDKWDSALTFASPDETTGVLEIKIQAASVDTGSGMKNGKLKSKDFFDAEQNPLITFESTKFVQTGPETYEVDGNFTIRGVSNPEKLTLTVSGKGTGSADINGKMVFNRKNYGMNKGIPFIKIADHVDVDFHLKEKHVGGARLAFKEQAGRPSLAFAAKDAISDCGPLGISPFVDPNYLLSNTTRSYSGCVGRASCRYNFANCAISSGVTVTGCFNTNQVTFSLQGGVVSDPENV